MNTKQKRIMTLFLSTFQLSACTLGGGMVIIPLMKKKFVDELHWIDEQEMLDMAAIAQSSPGAIAVNASILVGYRVAGLYGALFTVLATVLPPLIIISIISFFYNAFRNNPIINMAMTGMLAAVAAVLFDIVLTMGSKVLGRKRALPVIVMIASFIAVRFLKINIILIILCCGLIGAIDTLITEKKQKEATK